MTASSLHRPSGLPRDSHAVGARVGAAWACTARDIHRAVKLPLVLLAAGATAGGTIRTLQHRAGALGAVRAHDCILIASPERPAA